MGPQILRVDNIEWHLIKIINIYACFYCLRFEKYVNGKVPFPIRVKECSPQKKINESKADHLLCLLKLEQSQDFLCAFVWLRTFYVSTNYLLGSKCEGHRIKRGGTNFMNIFFQQTLLLESGSGQLFTCRRMEQYREIFDVGLDLLIICAK